MTTALKSIYKGYLSLFSQWSTIVEPDDKTPGHVIDARSLAKDWKRIGAYMQNAINQWERGNKSPDHQ